MKKSMSGGKWKVIYFILIFISLLLITSLFFALNVSAEKVVFKGPEETVEADVTTKWGMFFVDQDGNIIHDGDQMCIGDKVYVQKKADVDWFFQGGQTYCPEAQIIPTGDMKKLYCKSRTTSHRTGNCPSCYQNSALHRFSKCPWSSTPDVGSVIIDRLDDAKLGLGGRDYSCLGLKIKTYVISSNLKYQINLGVHTMNVVCNGTTSSGQDLADVSSSPVFVKELDIPGTLTLDSSTYPAVMDDLTVWCVFWHAWSNIQGRSPSSPNGCLRNGRACLPQSYFPKTLSPSFSKIKINVANPSIYLNIVNPKMEKDTSGDAIVSFNLTNVGSNNVSVHKIKILNGNVEYYYDIIKPLPIGKINSGNSVRIILKLKKKFCSLINLNNLKISVEYHGSPEIICHGRRIYRTIYSTLTIPTYPAHNLKVGVVNSTIPVTDVLDVGSSLNVYEPELIKEINKYLKECTTPECVIPINISISNDAYLILSNFRVSYSSCLLNKELLAHILSCWERGNYGKEDRDFMCYQIVVPQECTGINISPDIIVNLLKEQDLCDVIGNKDLGCGKLNQLDIEVNRILNQGDNILIEYRDNKVVVS